VQKLKLCVRYSCPRSDCAVGLVGLRRTRRTASDCVADEEEDAKFDDDEFDAGAKRGALATGDGDAQRFIRSSARTVCRVREMRAVRETNG
jgi:hypothetical protein